MRKKYVSVAGIALLALGAGGLATGCNDTTPNDPDAKQSAHATATSKRATSHFTATVTDNTCISGAPKSFFMVKVTGARYKDKIHARRGTDSTAGAYQDGTVSFAFRCGDLKPGKHTLDITNVTTGQSTAVTYEVQQ